MVLHVSLVVAYVISLIDTLYACLFAEKKSDSLSPKYASVEVDPKMEREIKEMIDRVSSSKTWNMLLFLVIFHCLKSCVIEE